MLLTRINDVDLHVEDSGGSGRPVILIHGWPLSAQSWELQVPALVAAGYRVIAYDRRGFGRSGPGGAYDYDTLAADLAGIIDTLDLTDATLVCFSMGGGEVARYLARHGSARIRSAVFAAAVPPYLLQTDDNPDGPLTQSAADAMEQGLRNDRVAFFDDFTAQFFSVKHLLGLVTDLKVSEDVRQKAIEMCLQSDQTAALACMKSFATTDFRSDLTTVSIPTLVLHGEGDATVSFDGSGKRTHAAIPQSELVVIPDAPHGLNASHPDAFNSALLSFLGHEANTTRGI